MFSEQERSGLEEVAQALHLLVMHQMGVSGALPGDLLTHSVL